MLPNTSHIKVYTDGSYRGGKSGYGAVVQAFNNSRSKNYSHQFFLHGGFDSEPDHWQMPAEIIAVEKAIRFALEKQVNSVTVYYDCTAVRFWARRKSFHTLMDDSSEEDEYLYNYNRFIRSARRVCNIRFIKVKAHSSNPLNDMADCLARLGLYTPRQTTEFHTVSVSTPIPTSYNSRGHARGLTRKIVRTKIRPKEQITVLS